MAEDVSCPVACGQCCVDRGRPCVHLTATGCAFAREHRPRGCVSYLCGVGRATVDGVIDVAYGRYLREWEAAAERLRTDTSAWTPPLSVDKSKAGE